MQKQASDFVKEYDGYAVVTLTRPVTIDGETLSTLRLSEPTVADTERHQESKESESAREINLIASLCVIAPDDVRKLPMRDYIRLQAAAALFTH